MNTISNDFIIGLLSDKTKNTISKLFNLHFKPTWRWNFHLEDNILFNKDNARNRKITIVPDLKVLQVPSHTEETHLKSIDQELIKEDYVTSYPILFVYEFKDKNTIAITKLHIANWAENLYNVHTGEFEPKHYQYLDRYFSYLISYLGEFTDLKLVNLYFSTKENSLPFLTKECKYLKIDQESEIKLKRSKELKLAQDHIYDDLKDLNFELNINIDYLVPTAVPLVHPVTGMTVYYYPKESDPFKYSDYVAALSR